MALCPHCQRNTIGYFAKYGSWSGGPARCRECGGLSYMPPKSSGASIYGNLILVAWPLVAIALAIILESVLWAAVAMVVILAALVVAHEFVLHRTKLVPITEGEVRTSRRFGAVFAAVLVVVAIVFLGIRGLA